MSIIGLGGVGSYMHSSTIKAAVNKKFKDVKIDENTGNYIDQIKHRCNC